MEKKLKQLILIRGLSGSGKTTLANTICEGQNDRIMLSADDYFTDDEGNYNFDPNSLKEAHEWCKSETASAIEDNYEVVVVHNTFTRKWEIDPYRELGDRNGYRVQILNLYDGGLSDNELSDRGVHKIPSYVIQKQRKRWDKDVYRERRNDTNRPRYHHNHPPPRYDNRYQNTGYNEYNGRRGYNKKAPKW